MIVYILKIMAIALIYHISAVKKLDFRITDEFRSVPYGLNAGHLFALPTPAVLPPPLNTITANPPFSRHHVISRATLRNFWNFCVQKKGIDLLRLLFPYLLRPYTSTSRKFRALDAFVREIGSAQIVCDTSSTRGAKDQGHIPRIDDRGLLYLLQNIYVWPLWNLFVGPSEGIRADEPDAGKFDENALYALRPGLFKVITNLNNLMEKAMADDDLETAVSSIDLMIKLYRSGIGMTKIHPKNWLEVKGSNKWELVPIYVSDLDREYQAAMAYNDMLTNGLASDAQGSITEYGYDALWIIDMVFIGVFASCVCVFSLGIGMVSGWMYHKYMEKA